MSFNFQDYNDVVILPTKIQFCKKQFRRTNFRTDYTNEELNDGIMINFPFESTYYSFKSQTSQIPLTTRFERAGVIPYVVIDDIKYFCLGVDSNFGTLTDFGGGVKKGELFSFAAARELFEESLGVFRFSSKSIYRYTTSVYDKNMIIIFLQINSECIPDATAEFLRRYTKVSKSENSGVMWIPEDVFGDLVKSGKSVRQQNYLYPSIYKPVADLLRSASCPNGLI
jgi:hypothetical protein